MATQLNRSDVPSSPKNAPTGQIRKHSPQLTHFSFSKAIGESNRSASPGHALTHLSHTENLSRARIQRSASSVIPESSKMPVRATTESMFISLNHIAMGVYSEIEYRTRPSQSGCVHRLGNSQSPNRVIFSPDSSVEAASPLHIRRKIKLRWIRQVYFQLAPIFAILARFHHAR
jgi:hypothetical protein